MDIQKKSLLIIHMIKLYENLMFDLRFLSRMPLTGIKRVSSTWDTLQT